MTFREKGGAQVSGPHPNNPIPFEYVMCSLDVGVLTVRATYGVWLVTDAVPADADRGAYVVTNGPTSCATLHTSSFDEACAVAAQLALDPWWEGVREESIVRRSGQAVTWVDRGVGREARKRYRAALRAVRREKRAPG